MTSARMPVWMERKLWYRLMWETERTTDLNVFYDKSLHPDLCSLSLKCTFDTYTPSVQGIRTGIYEYRDETFNHDAFLVVLLSLHSLRSHSEPSFFFPCFSTQFASWHAYVLFFIDRLVLRFLFTFSRETERKKKWEKSKSLTHVLCV